VYACGKIDERKLCITLETDKSGRLLFFLSLCSPPQKSKQHTVDNELGMPAVTKPVHNI
jgi:hypothetical protein